MYLKTKKNIESLTMFKVFPFPMVFTFQLTNHNLFIVFTFHIKISIFIISDNLNTSINVYVFNYYIIIITMIS